MVIAASGVNIHSLTASQFATVYNLFSLVIARMLFTSLFLLLSRGRVAPRYRNALAVSAMVCGIAAYHYFRIFDNFKASYPAGATVDAAHVLSHGRVQRGLPYVDWFLTVPLLLIETVAVMALGARQPSGRCSYKLVPASALMIALGYPGEIATSTGTRVLWGAAVDDPLHLPALRAVRRAVALARPPAGRGQAHHQDAAHLAGRPVGRLPDRLHVPDLRWQLLRRRRRVRPAPGRLLASRTSSPRRPTGWRSTRSRGSRAGSRTRPTTTTTCWSRCLPATAASASDEGLMMSILDGRVVAPAQRSARQAVASQPVRAGVAMHDLRVLTWLPVTALLGLLLLSVAAPADAERIALPTAVVGALLGLPHGAVDHLVPLWWGNAPTLSRAHLLGFVGGYGAVALAALGLFLLLPTPMLLVFLVLSAAHFGRGEIVTSAERAGRPVPALSDEWPAAAALGTAVVGLLLWAHPAATDPYLRPVSPWLARHAVADRPVGLLVVAVVVLAGAVALVRARRVLELAELALLVVAFAVCPPLAAFGVYFGLWHALRHTGRLLDLARRHQAPDADLSWRPALSAGGNGFADAHRRGPVRNRLVVVGTRLRRPAV